MKSKIGVLLILGMFLNSALLGQQEKSSDLIEKGLAYLASVQSTSKGIEDLTGPSIEPTAFKPEESKIAGHWQSNVGITALCLQAFLANGHNVNDPVYGTNVTNAINYILGQQITSGYHTGAFNQTTIGYGTAMAIVALQMALDYPGLVDPLRTQVQNAVNLAMNYYTQDVNVGWSQVSWRYDRSYTSQLSGDMSVNQWVYLALDATKYTDKDIWNKVYGYINTRKASSGNRAWIGYTNNPNTWTRGNTAAAIWGLIFAQGNNVAGAGNLAEMMFNYLEQNSLANLFPANQWTNLSSHVYSGGGYYYLIYELAKALSLGGKTNFSNSPWYNHLYTIINGQKYTDANGNYYWDGWGGQGVPMETALALLSLQTQTVPPGSKLTITLNDQNYVDDCTEFSITNEFGNEALVTPLLVENNIAQSQWTQTNQVYMEWEIELESAGYYNTLITNLCFEPKVYELCFRVFIEGSLVDEECFNESKSFITVPPQSSVSATSFVNSIGGLNIVIVNPPAIIPLMQLQPNVIGYNPFEYSQTFNFTFDVTETGNESPLLNVDIFASALVDQFGNTIPASSFTFVPNTIAQIPAGSSVQVQGSLTTPASFAKQDIGLFQGVITAQTNQQAKAIYFEIGKPTLTASPDVLNVDHLAGTTGFNISFTGFVGADWTVSTDADWIDLSPTTGSGNALVSVNYNQNPTPLERSATILVESVAAFNDETIVEINQDAGIVIDGQLITLKSGWSGISSYMMPTTPNLVDVFNEASGDLVIMLGKSGIFWPAQNINTIGNWNPYDGYKVKMNAAAQIIITGEEVIDKTANLSLGANFLPVLSPESVPASTIFDQIEDELLFAFDLDGFVYWPDGGIFDLQLLTPGKAYLLSMLANASVIFPESDGGKQLTGNKLRVVENSPWEVTNTGNPHIISIFEEALTDLKQGDIIAALNTEGVCVGLTQFAGEAGNLPLVVYGNDLTTELVDGLVEDEAITLKIYDPLTQNVTEVYPVWDNKMPNNGQFAENGLSAIMSLKAGAAVTEHSLSNLSIYPNPNTGTFNVTGINESVEIHVVNTTGQVIEQFTTDQSIEINLSSLAKGIYYLKVVSEKNIRIEKIIIR